MSKTSAAFGALSDLVTELGEKELDCCARIEFCKTSWSKLFDPLVALKKRVRSEGLPMALERFGLGDETMWTFLVAAGYAAAGREGVLRLSRKLTGQECVGPKVPKIWLEALPIPPRNKEGNTNLDMAVGHIAGRGSRVEGGIELEVTEDQTWVAFCEMKCFSDLSTKVTHDLERTQLLRVIDNALCFQAMGPDGVIRYVDRPTVTLVTPRRLWEGTRRSRLYHFLYAAYEGSQGRAAVLEDLRASHASGRLPYRDEGSQWQYPAETLPLRVEALELRQLSFDELYEGLPLSSLRAPIQEFFRLWSWFSSGGVSA